ncbi:MAG: radical SAM protein [Thermodesulfobacteriota bacterium]
MTKVQLVNLVASKEDFLDDRWPVPLNLLWPGTYLKEFGYDVEILDTNIISLQEAIDKIDAPMVGISFYATSAYLLDKVAREAKDKGATVVVGGQAATPLARQILTGSTDIDAVVLGDGERALLNIMKKVDGGSGDFAGIPNVAYRNGEDIVFGPSVLMDLTSLPMPDRTLKGIDMERYISNFADTNTDRCRQDVRATNAYMKKGCPRRIDDRGCSFCARVDRGLREKSALQAYEEYKYLNREFDINYIYDDSDSWVGKPWMRSLLDLYNRFGSLDVKFRVYADVRDINRENAEMMRELGVDAVLVGIESGDESVLRFNGKPMTKERIVKAAKILGEVGIKLCDAYVLGLIGESKKSIERTISLAKQIENYCERQIAYWNVIMPLPGSPIWNNMMKVPSLYEKYGSQYNIDIEEVRRDYLHHFCNLGKDGDHYLTNICNHLQSSQKIPLRKYIR